MATAELRLLLPLDQARDAVGSALAEQGFAVQPTAGGSLDVSRGSLGTTVVAGAFAGQDMHVRFDVHLSPDAEGTLAVFEHSAVGGFVKGGAVGAARVGEIVRDAAHLAGVRLAQQGLLAGGSGSVPAPAAPNTASGIDAPEGAPAPPVAPGGHPVPPAPGGHSAPAVPGGYPASPAPVGHPASAVPGGSPIPPAGYAAVPPGFRYGAPAPVPGAEQRTNTVAIVAIVLGFVLPIGGIIAGSVALAQVKRTGEKGRGLAIGGIVAGAVMMVLSIIVGVALFLLFALGAASSSAGSPLDPFLPPAENDTFALPVGTCLDELATTYITSDNVLDCAQPHNFEIFSSFLVDDGAFPGESVFEDQAYEKCDAAFAAFVGIPYADSTLDYTYLSPTKETWAQGDREILCMIFDPSVAQTTGSLAASKR